MKRDKVAAGEEEHSRPLHPAWLELMVNLFQRSGFRYHGFMLPRTANFWSLGMRLLPLLLAVCLWNGVSPVAAFAGKARVPSWSTGVAAAPEAGAGPEPQIVFEPVAQVGAPVVRVLEQGVFSGPETPPCATPPCSGPLFTLEKETRLVPLELLQRFGVMYVVEGNASDPPVTLTVHIRHPRLEDPATGRSRVAHVWNVSVQPGTRQYAGWEFSAQWEMVAGEWALELYHDETLLHRTVFQAAQSDLCRNIELRYALGESAATTAVEEFAAVAPATAGARFTVQTASCLRRESALRAAEDLERRGYDTRVERSQWEGGVWYVVRFGVYETKREAVAAARSYSREVGREAVTVAVGE